MECQSCERRFRPRREWQVFCSNKCKCNYNRLHKEYCFYCGERGNHRDHIHPANLRGYPRLFKNQEFVYACAECNTTLTDHLFDSIVERIEYLITAYKAKYFKDLLVKWDKEDLGDFGPNLRRAIEVELKIKNIIEERLKYLHNVKIKLLNNMDEV